MAFHTIKYGNVIAKKQLTIPWTAWITQQFNKGAANLSWLFTHDLVGIRGCPGIPHVLLRLPSTSNSARVA